jgi:tripartite-type tricarboxylate transporter receptor subunit TctC
LGHFPLEKLMMHRRIVLALLGSGLAGASLVRAQSGYPTKPVKLVVPYPAGQGADIFGRMVAERLGQKWGHQIVVDNKGGGGGVPGTTSVKMAPADGYTMMVGGSQAITVNPNLYAKMPYEPMKDFIAVSGLYIAPLVWVVHPSSGITSLAQLVDMAKKQPGKLSYASAGTGTSQHMTAELFMHTAKIQMAHVAYRGSGPAMTDLLGGQVQIMMDGLASALPHITSGKLRALAVTTPQRVPQMPDLPTIAEQGFPGFTGVGWAGLFVPANTPADIVEKISADVRAVLAEPEMRKRIIDRGAIPDPLTPQQAADFIRTDTAKWGEVARVANVKVE